MLFFWSRGLYPPSPVVRTRAPRPSGESRATRGSCVAPRRTAKPLAALKKTQTFLPKVLDKNVKVWYNRYIKERNAGNLNNRERGFEMARIEAEFQRVNVTVGRFLSYVRAQLKKRGLDEWAGNLDYDNFTADNGVDGKTDHKAKNDEVYALYGIELEIVRDRPYNKQTFEKRANGKVYNEIIEFAFDSESTGHGYYYLTDSGAEDEVESVESTADETTVAESETESEPVESVDNDENNSCGERAATSQTNEGADNLSTAREEYKMRRTMKFANRYEYEKWVDEQQRRCEHTDEIVCVVDDGRRLTAELTTMCDEPVTAVHRLFEGLGLDEPELDGWQDSMVEAVSSGIYSGSVDGGGEWECVHVGDKYYNGYYVSVTVYRGQVDEEEVKNIALGAIAREFAQQQKYYGFCNDRWAYGLPDTNDYVVQYWYGWKDESGCRHKDCVEIWLSDACRMAGVDFDPVDDGDIEGRMLEEMENRGYTVDDDNEIVIDDDADEYAICEEMNEVRSELWEEAQNEAEQARDELCEHEDLSEPWFRELCEEMLAKVNATLAE